MTYSHIPQNSEELADGTNSMPAPAPVPVSAPIYSGNIPGINLLKTLPILRGIGYGLLLLAFVDLLYIVFPLELTKPVWEYQVIGDLIRLVPVPILAFMLVFYGETTGRRRLERPVIRTLSWSTLFFGVVLLLMIPLTVINTMRISSYNNDQINIQIKQQKLQLDTTKGQLEKASLSQLQSLIPVPDEKTGQLPDAPKNPEEARTQVLSSLQKARETAELQATQARNNVQQNLMKNSGKIIIEALIAGCIFLYMWHMTSWARQRLAEAYEAADQSGTEPATKRNRPTFQRRRRRR
jgi:hypothetical protein